ncbi:hypothetical protein O181_015559 [Austropuccinia psidii MF-1]|uniref:Uncharacterized protein n=1 Tax=Austropuccinia psidii MF-1 TaxID=1389203 RepID=A0A9Q3C054_9BASI|nr:hypothetical protein [Austropuccinia psidii MF-1]
MTTFEQVMGRPKHGVKILNHPSLSSCDLSQASESVNGEYLMRSPQISSSKSIFGRYSLGLIDLARKQRMLTKLRVFSFQFALETHIRLFTQDFWPPPLHPHYSFPIMKVKLTAFAVVCGLTLTFRVDFCICPPAFSFEKSALNKSNNELLFSEGSHPHISSVSDTQVDSPSVKAGKSYFDLNEPTTSSFEPDTARSSPPSFTPQEKIGSERSAFQQYHIANTQTRLVKNPKATNKDPIIVNNLMGISPRKAKSPAPLRKSQATFRSYKKPVREVKPGILVGNKYFGKKLYVSLHSWLRSIDCGTDTPAPKEQVKLRLKETYEQMQKQLRFQYAAAAYLLEHEFKAPSSTQAEAALASSRLTNQARQSLHPQEQFQSQVNPNHIFSTVANQVNTPSSWNHQRGIPWQFNHPGWSNNAQRSTA